MICNEDFADYEKTAKYLALRVYNHARANGESSFTYEEAYSDVCLTWVYCRDNFNPEKGVKFRTYFWNAVLKNRGNFANRRRRQLPANTVSFDQPIHTSSASEDGELRLENILGDDKVDVEGDMFLKEQLEQIAYRYPLIARLLQLSLEQPDDLMNELDALKEHHRLLVEKGMHSDINFSAEALTPEILKKIMDFNWRHKQKLMKDMSDAAQLL